MKKVLPDKMFSDTEQSRLGTLRNWVLDNSVTEIAMSEKQFWNFVHLQPLAEKPWVSYMGRAISVSDMPETAQKTLGLFDKRGPGAI